MPLGFALFRLDVCLDAAKFSGIVGFLPALPLEGSESQPRVRALVRTASARSSNGTKMPGSPASAPPRTNSRANKLFPEPGPPLNSVVRAAGNPPRRISSSPGLPVGALIRMGVHTTGREQAAYGNLRMVRDRCIPRPGNFHRNSVASMAGWFVKILTTVRRSRTVLGHRTPQGDEGQLPPFAPSFHPGTPELRTRLPELARRP